MDAATCLSTTFDRYISIVAYYQIVVSRDRHLEYRKHAATFEYF